MRTPKAWVVTVTLALALCGSARAQVTQTVNTNLQAGDDNVAIATRVEAGWSQGAWNCSRILAELRATDTSGTCDTLISRYVYAVNNGVLQANHTMDLRLFCASPLQASVQVDGGGFVTLTPGANVFNAGPDTITISFSTFNPGGPGGGGGVPTLPTWGLIVMGGLLLVCGGYVVQRRTRVASSS